MITTQNIVYHFVMGTIGLKTYIIMVFWTILLILIPMFIHELGHVLYFKFIASVDKLRIGLNKGGIFVATDAELTIQEKIGVRAWGILFGLVFFVFIPDIFIFIAYLIGIRRDFTEMLGLLKQLKEGQENSQTT